MSSWNSEWEEKYPEVKHENDATVSIPLAEYRDLIVDARTWYARAVEQHSKYMDEWRRRYDLSEKVEKFEKFLSENEEIKDEFYAWEKGRQTTKED